MELSEAAVKACNEANKEFRAYLKRILDNPEEAWRGERLVPKEEPRANG